MSHLVLSVHLSSLLNALDVDAIKSYLERQPKMGIHLLDRHFAIRKSNGLVSFARIDIYVSSGGMIFLSSIEEDNTSPISIELNTT